MVALFFTFPLYSHVPSVLVVLGTLLPQTGACPFWLASGSILLSTRATASDMARCG